MAAMFAGGGYAYINRDKLPQLSQLPQLAQFAKLPNIEINASEAGSRISAALDSIVTHPDKNSPVVLGVKITNESIGKLVDVIQGLPPEQVKQIQQVICATPSAR
ncbi:MAG: hypothetical protein G01um101416_178 [Microgenomates group bacterium Gr01-1014_16]|nr:MAG: hypothetical protein G01um101416_178 [Microgenomates group bacterium Gr01-1014_16]